jgi:hypothetical protein
MKPPNKDVQAIRPLCDGQHIRQEYTGVAWFYRLAAPGDPANERSQST